MYGIKCIPAICTGEIDRLGLFTGVYGVQPFHLQSGGELQWGILFSVNDERNSTLYASYKSLADKEEKVIFGGHFGKYKYYDMEQVIAAALERVEGLE